jgi:predicted tellurium resistance membrane protein TerC
MPDFAATLALLVALELVLGVDNIVALSIIVSRLPEATRQKARIAGLALALVARLVMVWGATWLLTLTEPVMEWFPAGGDLIRERSIKDLILLAGGAFLIWKATREIHHTVELKEEGPVEASGGAKRTLWTAVLTIVAVDVVFALDSVITAVGMTQDLTVIALAVILSFVALLFAAGPIGEFVLANPSFKILALSFLITIGVALGLEAFHHEVPKPYIYLPMAFATAVQLLQWRLSKNERRAAREPAAPAVQVAADTV